MVELSEDTTVQGKVTGIIYPPPDVRAIVDKTAHFVARNGRSFEKKIAGETISAKFSFLRLSDPYHNYYEHKVSEFIEKNKKEANGEVEKVEEEKKITPQELPKSPDKEQIQPQETSIVIEKKAVEAVTAKAAKKVKDLSEVKPPEEELFKIKHPHLTALDQEIMYLTAQYTALNGKSFLSGLATREQRNPQFDFLKPTHALFAYFTALVESYTHVLSKTEKQMKKLQDGLERMNILDRCVYKLEFMRREQEKKDQEAAETDAERIALAQIDWYDFIIVETITFDDEAEEEEAATQAQRQQQEEEEEEDMDVDMEEEEEEEDNEENKPQIKVVENYVPLASSSRAGTISTAANVVVPMMNVDGKAVPTSEANEHMRILLMNPKWREETQRHLEKQKDSSFAAGDAIAENLKRFATKRSDIFTSSAEEEARLLQHQKKIAEEKEEAAAKKQKEMEEAEAKEVSKQFQLSISSYLPTID
jgi:splicing factor 3A subunit 1